MKIDICEKTYTSREICSEIKHCCIMMKSMVKQNHITIDPPRDGDDSWKPEVRLYLDYDRNRYQDFARTREEGIIDISSFVTIQYCPFCGEKIE